MCSGDDLITRAEPRKKAIATAERAQTGSALTNTMTNIYSIVDCVVEPKLMYLLALDALVVHGGPLVDRAQL